ncbi:MAG: nuclease-related domain-containing protein [Brevinema sp.]
MGERAENHLLYLLQNYGINPADIFHNLYIEKPNKQFSQIDVVVLTDVGIIVFEVKNYSGWIFGNGNNTDWTKTLAYGKKKYRFYNPLKQNISHIQSLRNKLWQFKVLPFYSVIVFDGDCVLKKIKCVPQTAYVLKISEVQNVLNTIIKSNPSINYNREAVRESLMPSTDADSTIRERHIQNINDILKK